MAIRLKWKNPNAGATVVRIYRGAAPLDLAAMPAPIAEISDGSTSYLDNFPKYGESYYYVFSVIVNGREVFTPNKYYSCVIDLGPGPKDIVIGDFKLGYFGTVSVGDIGFSPNIYGSNAAFSTLHKFARNGKIIYSPVVAHIALPSTLQANKVLTSGVTARNDPAAGAYGMIRDFGGRLYALRITKFWDDTNTDTVFANYATAGGPNFPNNVPAPHGKSELIDFLRIGRQANADIPARFSLGVDTRTYVNTNEQIFSCDFASATTMVGQYGIGTTTLTALAFATAQYCIPVIEYKGLV